MLQFVLFVGCVQYSFEEFVFFCVGFGVVLSVQSCENVGWEDFFDCGEFVDGKVFKVSFLDVKFFIVVNSGIVCYKLGVYWVVLCVVVVEKFVVQVFNLCFVVYMVCQ